MSKEEIIKSCCKGIVIDADNLDDVYEVYDANKLYDLAYQKGGEEASIHSSDETELDAFNL